MTRRLAPILVIAWCAHARADDGAFQGFQTLGVAPDEAALLEPAALNGLRAGGLMGDVEVVAASGRCIDDLPCYCAALRGRGLRFGAYGSISQLGDLWTIELSLVDSHACTIEA